MECKESGTAIDDVIDYVCLKMFKHLSKPDSNNEDDTIDEEATNSNEENIVEAPNELEEEMILDNSVSNSISPTKCAVNTTIDNEQCPQLTKSPTKDATINGS